MIDYSQLPMLLFFTLRCTSDQEAMLTLKAVFGPVCNACYDIQGGLRLKPFEEVVAAADQTGRCTGPG